MFILMHVYIVYVFTISIKKKTCHWRFQFLEFFLRVDVVSDNYEKRKKKSWPVRSETCFPK